MIVVNDSPFFFQNAHNYQIGAISIPVDHLSLTTLINKPSLLLFGIRTLGDDCLIGTIDLDGIQWNHSEAFVGIGLGERSFWGKGYGTDAMRIMLRYVFTELNLHRQTLTVFDYNPRAIRSYEKAGFIREGCIRSFLNRDGKRWDMLFMGILKEEWFESLQQDTQYAIRDTHII